MSQKAFLTIQTPNLDSEPIKIIITDEVTSLGRSSSNKVKLRDSAASRKHCLITRRENSYYLVDLGSKNGIQVNDINVKEKELKTGDIIQIGRESIVFNSGEETANTSPAQPSPVDKTESPKPTATTPASQPSPSPSLSPDVKPAAMPSPSSTGQNPNILDILVVVFRSALISVFLLVVVLAGFDLAIKKEWIRINESFSLADLWKWGFYGIFGIVGLQFLWLLMCLLFFKKRWQKYNEK